MFEESVDKVEVKGVGWNNGGGKGQNVMRQLEQQKI